MQTAENKSIIEEVKALEGIEAKKSWLWQFNKSTILVRAMNGGIGVNELLCGMYAKEGATELHTFNGWKEKGYKVKKGAKALIIWSSPKGGAKNEAGVTATTAEQNTAPDSKAPSFYGIAHIFAQSDVEKI